MAIHIRVARPADSEACGRIIYEAFQGIAERHGFSPDFPAVETATQLAQSFIAHPSIFGVVAEEDGSVVGSNFLAEGDAIRGVGPITVDPRRQGGGIGRCLMAAVLERGSGAAGIRLLQDAFNMRSVSLYASLGFDVREPVLVMTGRPSSDPGSGITVRRMTERDLDACNALCARIHGFSRASELADAMRLLAPMVSERDGIVTGYLTAPTFWIANHGLAETEADMRALILGAGAANAEPLSFLLPVRQARLFRWCLSEGLKAAKPMTLMTIGEYRTPGGSYIPSVFY
ncbi:MAG: GNAT family N-acetyltransferase [Mesorhizobium sp.]|uniref:GNAT family N-acetyltransferase n=1 Tax=Mesorhizobium sp. TaxID=1871066 RepID=UPI000FE8980B|nr:GNAT family N-acetyltransferase [Mesorhizobium sp.]RWM89641.1 MAG: GNAT family N-acetyltransferase [Mesorhizobium sp.]